MSLYLSYSFLLKFKNLCLQIGGFRLCKFNTGFPQWLSHKESTWNAGCTKDMDLIPGLEKSPGGGRGNPFQYSCLENHRERGAWQAAVHRAVVFDRTEATYHTSTFNITTDMVGCKSSICCHFVSIFLFFPAFFGNNYFYDSILFIFLGMSYSPLWS